MVDFPQLPGVAASMSPFVTKVEAALRFAGVDYGKKHASLEDLRAAPKGQVGAGKKCCAYTLSRQ